MCLWFMQRAPEPALHLPAQALGTRPSLRGPTQQMSKWESWCPFSGCSLGAQRGMVPCSEPHRWFHSHKGFMAFPCTGPFFFHPGQMAYRPPMGRAYACGAGVSSTGGAQDWCPGGPAQCQMTQPQHAARGLKLPAQGCGRCLGPRAPRQPAAPLCPGGQGRAVAVVSPLLPGTSFLSPPGREQWVGAQEDLPDRDLLQKPPAWRGFRIDLFSQG